MIDPAERGFYITISGTQTLEHATRGLYVGAQGSVNVVTAGGDSLIFTDLAGGVIHPLRIRQVVASGTTATNIIGVY
jgi:hypothetical protein